MITRMGLGEGGEGEWKGGTLGRGRECRVGVLGEPGVGKNALVARFVRGKRHEYGHTVAYTVGMCVEAHEAACLLCSWSPSGRVFNVLQQPLRCCA